MNSALSVEIAGIPISLRSCSQAAQDLRVVNDIYLSDVPFLPNHARIKLYPTA